VVTYKKPALTMVNSLKFHPNENQMAGKDWAFSMEKEDGWQEMV